MIKLFKYSKIYNLASLQMKCNSTYKPEAPETTHFGFKTVNMTEKQGLVNSVFDSVANKYDIMNDLMSLGIHRCWKETFVSDIGTLSHDAVVLDVAGGTGDISFKILEKQRERRGIIGVGGFKVFCCDINDNMLEGGRIRAKEKGLKEEEITFIQGDAEVLSQIADNSIDLYTISFGLRNVPSTQKALQAAHRVLKKGGRFMCLEFSKFSIEPLSPFYKFYNFNILPFMGQIIANDSESYRYLAESIEKFHDQQTLLNLMEEAGFKFSSFKNLSGGICAIHSGFKL